MKVTNYILVTIVIIPPGRCSDVAVISPSPAELLPATLIVYVPNRLGQYCHVIEDVVFCITSSPP